MQTYWVYRGVLPFEEDDVTFVEEPTKQDGLLTGTVPYDEVVSVKDGGELKSVVTSPPRYTKGDLVSCPVYKSLGKVVSARLLASLDFGAWQYKLEMEDPELDTPVRSGYRKGEPFSEYFVMEYAASPAS